MYFWKFWNCPSKASRTKIISKFSKLQFGNLSQIALPNLWLLVLIGQVGTDGISSYFWIFFSQNLVLTKIHDSIKILNVWNLEQLKWLNQKHFTTRFSILWSFYPGQKILIIMFSKFLVCKIQKRLVSDQ